MSVRRTFGAALIVGCLTLAGFGSSGATASQSACLRVSKLIVIDLDNVKHRNIIDHALDARRSGHPRILHIARHEQRANRRASLRAIPTRRGFDRDEYPPAMSDEGGKGADVRYIKSSENRSAGSLMGLQLRRYCNGQRFVVESSRSR